MDDLQGVLLETFREEAFELMAELESALLELEKNPEDMKLVDRVFRALHTLKGNGAMFGFEEISTFAHDIESAFDMVRSGKIRVSKDLVELTFSARDVIQSILEEKGRISMDLLHSSRTLANAFREMVEDDGEKKCRDDVAASDGLTTRAAAQGGCQTYRIRFRPDADIFATGTNPLALLNELRGLGECRAVAHVGKIPPLDTLVPDHCYVHWDIILTTCMAKEAVEGVFIFMEDRCSLAIELIGDEFTSEYLQDKRLGEILVERGDISPEELEPVLKERKLLGQELRERKLVDEDLIEASLLEQQVIRQARQKRQTEQTGASIRVASAKLDGLVNLVGELVTVQSQLSRTASKGQDPELAAISERIERLVWELRDSTFSIRMVPIATTFNRFARLVRDLSIDTGKEVEFLTEGGDTELDKTVIEKLTDPMVHLIRNCIDHGIEDPASREKMGKERKGKVFLSALHSGASVLIRISDDGRGLDEDGIRRKAVEKGLLSPSAEVSGTEIFSLIFTPAFSTAEEVTNMSGRGVGLDVVKRAVEELRGSIEVESFPRRGTTVTMALPLTLAIIEGLLVKLGKDKFVIPLSTVEECVELRNKNAGKNRNRDLAVVRDSLIPYIRLRDWFGVQGDPPDIEQIVLTRNGGETVGIVIDSIIGELQAVIKSLGKVYRGVEGVSGATILGDGSVALILDVGRLVSLNEGAAGNTPVTEGKYH